MHLKKGLFKRIIWAKEKEVKSRKDYSKVKYYDFG